MDKVCDVTDKYDRSRKRRRTTEDSVSESNSLTTHTRSSRRSARKENSSRQTQQESMTFSFYSDSSSYILSSSPSSSVSSPSSTLSDVSSSASFPASPVSPALAEDKSEKRSPKKKKVRGIKGKAYKHIPHSLKPPHLVAKRNARERKRVQAVNSAFSRLRKHVPYEPRHKRLSKVKTLRFAIEYIQHLQELIKHHDHQMSKERHNLGTCSNVSLHHHHHHLHHHHYLLDHSVSNTSPDLFSYQCSLPVKRRAKFRQSCSTITQNMTPHHLSCTDKALHTIQERNKKSFCPSDELPCVISQTASSVPSLSMGPMTGNIKLPEGLSKDRTLSTQNSDDSYINHGDYYINLSTTSVDSTAPQYCLPTTHRQTELHPFMFQPTASCTVPDVPPSYEPITHDSFLMPENSSASGFPTCFPYTNTSIPSFLSSCHEEAVLASGIKRPSLTPDQSFFHLDPTKPSSQHSDTHTYTPEPYLENSQPVYETLQSFPSASKMTMPNVQTTTPSCQIQDGGMEYSLARAFTSVTKDNQELNLRPLSADLQPR